MHTFTYFCCRIRFDYPLVSLFCFFRNSIDAGLGTCSNCTPYGFLSFLFGVIYEYAHTWTGATFGQSLLASTHGSMAADGMVGSFWIVGMLVGTICKVLLSSSSL